MKKGIVILVFISLHFIGAAQQGNELLVYAVKGNVTAVYKNEESRVRIGKVLKPGMILKTEKEASLTMLCTKGKPISVTKEGVYQVSRWKDSCRSNNSSITSKYFRYIWEQLYAYSPEHLEEKRKQENLAVSRGEPPLRSRPVVFTRLEFKPGMDTVNYGGEPFPLSWTGTGYRGIYHFTLYDARGKDILFRDSMRASFIAIDSFKSLLQPGVSYRWTVSAKGVPVSKKRVLNYIDPVSVEKLVSELLEPGSIPEDSTVQSFRVGYILEQKHFLGTAYQWYQRAAAGPEELNLYRDQLIRFRNDYWIR